MAETKHQKAIRVIEAELTRSIEKSLQPRPTLEQASLKGRGIQDFAETIPSEVTHVLSLMGWNIHQLRELSYSVDRSGRETDIKVIVLPLSSLRYVFNTVTVS